MNSSSFTFFSRSYVVLSSINLSKTEETTDEIGMPFKQQKTHKTKGFKLIYIKHLNIPQKTYVCLEYLPNRGNKFKEKYIGQNI